MAANVPPALKSADIARFALRAAQVEKAKPSIAYWYLMDKLEKTKAEHGNDDTIMDDMAAQVYVEQFALETFQRAENAMRANKSSRQTADTLAAAVVFLELRQIWEPMDTETSSKVKYAKYHALRIAKAIKAGEDPNMSNPAPEPAPVQGQTLDPQDLDVQMLDGTPTQAAAYQPSVEEVPDEHDRLQRHLAQRSSIDQSLHPSRAPSVPRHPNQDQNISAEAAATTNNVEDFYQQAPAPDVSPLQSPERDRNESIGGGYFPKTPDAGYAPGQVPAINGQPHGLDYHPPPNLPDVSSPSPSVPSVPSAPSMPPTESFPSFPPSDINQRSMVPPSIAAGPYTPQPPSIVPAQAPRYQQPSAPSVIPQPLPVQTHQAIPSSFTQHQSNPPSFVANEEAIAKAQKHARWAISALNFEDVNTAVKELKGALESLGAR
ncbi:MAG: hypothetical protein Q9179_002072 [Wetmoreana sp. 5 TL-2023]